MHSTPRFPQNVLAFEGEGLDQPAPLGGASRFVVPAGVVAQAVCLRGGNSADGQVKV